MRTKREREGKEKMKKRPDDCHASPQDDHQVAQPRNTYLFYNAQENLSFQDHLLTGHGNLFMSHLILTK